RLQRYDVGADGDPVDPRRRGDHLLGAGVHGPRVGEVGVEPAAQALRLTDIDHPPGRVPEPVDTGRIRDRAGSGAIRTRIGHGTSLIGGYDGGPVSPPARRALWVQLTVIVSPLTVTFFAGSGLAAGPFFTDPSVALKALLWQG